MRRLAAILAVLAACTSSPPPQRGPVRGPTTGEDGEPVLPVAVVTTSDDAELVRTYLDGMRLAARETNRDGGIAGTPVRLDVLEGPAAIREQLPRSIATLAVGPGSHVARARADVERDGDPVFVLGGDLYSSRRMFRQVFQVTPPLAWQAEPLARYLVHDRGVGEVVLVTDLGTDEDEMTDAVAAALEEEGSELARSVSFTSSQPDLHDVSPAFGADGVILAGTADVATIAGPLAASATRPVVSSFASGLSTDPPPGAVAPYPYTWAAWADPIPRVHAFRERFERAFGREPAGFEQEGYDAVSLLAETLERTGGRGGPQLIAELEASTGATYSSLPISLGPDDHLLATRGQIGIFVRLAPREIDDRTSPTGAPWAPLMRTFTYNGLRTSVIDDDKRVFFPGWERKAPAPAYPRARFGITTGRDDPVH